MSFERIPVYKLGSLFIAEAFGCAETVAMSFPYDPSGNVNAAVLTIAYGFSFRVIFETLLAHRKIRDMFSDSYWVKPQPEIHGECSRSFFGYAITNGIGFFPGYLTSLAIPSMNMPFPKAAAIAYTGVAVNLATAMVFDLCDKNSNIRAFCRSSLAPREAPVVRADDIQESKVLIHIPASSPGGVDRLQ